MTRTAIVPMNYWNGEGVDAHIVHAQGVRVLLFYTREGNPTMVVDRPPRRKPTEADEYEDDLMMRWNRAVLDQIRKGTGLAVQLTVAKPEPAPAPAKKLGGKNHS